MARLLDPSSRPHEVSDDLESFFWVLLYLIAKGRKPKKSDVSRQMQLVFDQYDVGDDGITRGGRGKLICLREGGDLDFITVRKLVKTPCKAIVEELRSLFRDSYLHVRQEIDTDSETQEDLRRLREQDETVQSAIRKLQSSSEVLAIFDKHLAFKWAVDNDCSLCAVADLFPALESSASGGKRKAEDDGRSHNEKQKGKFPSSSSLRRRMLGPQLVLSSLGSGSGTRTSESQ